LEKKTPNDLNSRFKKEEEGGEGRSQLDSQWKVPMLGGQCKEREKEKHLFTSSHFPILWF
jgi:hypothetical protein